MFVKSFNLSSAAILLLTGIFKVLGWFGSARILDEFDPITGVSFRYLLLMVGIVELGVATICVIWKAQVVSSFLIGWLALNFLLYRLGLWSLDWHRPCGCLGNLTDYLNLSPETADIAIRFILAYFLIGSGIILFSFLKINVINNKE
jgi:hypothetical protein